MIMVNDMGFIKDLFGNNDKKRIIGFGHKDEGMFGSLSIYSKDFNEQYEEKVAIFLHKMKRAELKDKNEDYMSTLRYWYTIPYPHDLHLLLIKEGYYIKSDLNNILNAKTIPQLKDLAKELNITIKGKKDELVYQLESQMNDNNKNELLNKSRLYILSEKGNGYLNQHSDFVTLAEHYMWNITQKDIDDFRVNEPNYSVYEIAEAILLKRINHSLSIGLNNYSSSTCHCLAELYNELGNSREALKFYLGLLLLDINMTHFQNEEFYESYVNSVKDAYSNESYGVLPPGIIKTVLDNKRIIDGKLIQEAYDSVKNCSKIYLTDIEFDNMINDLIETDKIDEKKYLKLIVNRL